MDRQEPGVRSLVDRMRDKAKEMEVKMKVLEKSPAVKRKKKEVEEEKDRKKMRSVLDCWKNVDIDRRTVASTEGTVWCFCCSC